MLEKKTKVRSLGTIFLCGIVVYIGVTSYFVGHLHQKRRTTSQKHVLVDSAINYQTRLETKDSHRETNSEMQKHAMLIRKSKNNLIELQYSFDKTWNEIEKTKIDFKEKFNLIKSRLAMQIQSAIVDMEEMYLIDSEWRNKKGKELAELVQDRLSFIQNPPSCSSAKTFTCKFANNCGFGCQFHYFAYCFMIAYGLQRTLMFDFAVQTYDWNSVFLPISKNCTKISGSLTKWKGVAESEKEQHILFEPDMHYNDITSFRPLGFPEDISQLLLRLHGNPSVWWVGQFVHYLLKPQPKIKELIDNTLKEIGFDNIFVGIHVRRTDKLIMEASFHSIEEYMKHVAMWYDRQDLKLSKDGKNAKLIRRVYLASDDLSVLEEARRKFPDYVFYGNVENSLSASLAKRFTQSGLLGFLIDTFVLAKSNFLCCTFSSNVCRLSYELMQSYHPDASDFFHSLDDIYYYSGQMDHDQRAVLPHQGGDGEISFEVGDLIGIAGNHWDGYSKGKHKRTGKVGLYPSYKVEEVFPIIKYPSYKEAEKLL